MHEGGRADQAGGDFGRRPGPGTAGGTAPGHQGVETCALDLVKFLGPHFITAY